MPRNRNAQVVAPLSPTCQCCSRTFNARVERSSIADLCEFCFDEAGTTNAHNDGHHDAEADANCYICQDANPHAGLRTRLASGNQGKVMGQADGRLKVNAPALPENPERVKLTGTRLGAPAPKYAGLMASVIKRDNHVWGGHSSWVQVQVDGVTQRRWFWTEDVTPVRVRRQRATAQAA